MVYFLTEQPFESRRLFWLESRELVHTIGKKEIIAEREQS